MDLFFDDFRLAGRILLKDRAFALVAVLALAIGVGATTAVFSIADPLLTRPLPVADPDELVLFRTVSPRQAGGRDRVPQELFDRLASESQTLSAVFASYGFAPFVRITRVDGQASPRGSDRALVEPVTGNYFSALRVPPILGRPLSESDDRPEAELVAVISHRFWQRRFGGRHDVLGMTLRLENPQGLGESIGAPIVGVAARGFYGTNIDVEPDVWVPFESFREHGSSAEARMTGGVYGLRLMGRMLPEKGIEQVQAEVDVLAAGFTDRALPVNALRESDVRVETGTRGYSDLRLQYSQPLTALIVGVGLVLLMVCANLAALMFVRQSSRQREVAVRLAIGSSRLRIVRQALAEGLVLTVVGGSVGLLLSNWGMLALASYLPPDSGFISRLSLDTRVIAFACVASLFSMAVFAVVPAVKVSALNPNSVLTGACGRSSRPRSRFAATKVIVTAQIALSLVLLVAAFLFVQTLRNLRGVDTGFDTREIITFEIESPAGAAWDEFRRTGLERLAGMPGAAAVTVYGAYGLLGGSPVHSEIVAEGTGGSDEVETASRVIVGPGFFETMGIRLVSGREFTDADMGWARSSWVVILSESLADVLFPGESAVGRTLHFRMGDDGAFSDARVVGVAGDAKHGTVREEESATLYLPHNLGAGGAPTGTRFAVRTEGDAARLGATIRGVVETFDDSFFLADMRTLHEVMEASIVGERFVGQLMAILGVVALLLASLGIYGVLSYVVTQRTQEIGVRMALGAQTGQILRMLMREMTGAVSIGIVVGLCVLIMTTRAVSVILFGLTPTDPSTIAVAVLVLASAAGVASYVPARRASRADPLRALRQE